MVGVGFPWGGRTEAVPNPPAGGIILVVPTLAVGISDVVLKVVCGGTETVVGGTITLVCTKLAFGIGGCPGTEVIIG